MRVCQDPKCFANQSFVQYFYDDDNFCSYCGKELVGLKRCKKCGKELTHMAKFCISCGTKRES